MLRDDGTLRLNLGDSYAGDARKGQHKPGDPGKQAYVYDRGGGRASAGLDLRSEKRDSFDGCVGRADRAAKRNLGSNLKPKDLIGVPWMVAFALRDDGWYLRSEIIWHKPNALPERVKDRPTNAHEKIFLFSKSQRYFYDHEAVREAAVGAHSGAAGTFKRTNSKRNQMIPGQSAGTHRPDRPDSRYDGSLRNRRNVWSMDEHEYEQFLRWKAANGGQQTDLWAINTKPFKGAHFATFPPDLIEPCIKAGSPADGIVLDPFSGSGTAALVANRLGRNAILLEVNPDYANMARDRLIDSGINREDRVSRIWQPKIPGARVRRSRSPSFPIQERGYSGFVAGFLQLSERRLQTFKTAAALSIASVRPKRAHSGR